MKNKHREYARKILDNSQHLFKGGRVDDPDKQDEDVENHMALIMEQDENPHAEFPELESEEKEERKERPSLAEYLRMCHGGKVPYKR